MRTVGAQAAWCGLVMAFALCGCPCAPQPTQEDTPADAARVPARADAGGAEDASMGRDAAVMADAGDTPDAATPPAPPQDVVLQFGDDVEPRVRARVEQLLRGATVLPVRVVGAMDVVPQVRAPGFVLGVGSCAATRALVDLAETQALAQEGFILRSGTVNSSPTVVVDGVRARDAAAGKPPIGISYGVYALLEELGFAFLHPLAPTLPPALPSSLPVLDVSSAPRWPVRAWHLHTMHPLELTNVLNGWGLTGPQDATGWAGMLPDWDLFLEWMVANRQNRVEWNLLEADSWTDFSQSATRLQRLAQLVEMVHAWGLQAGMDVPIAQIQQHTFRLVLETGTLEDELRQIRERLDWLMGANFDYVSTESGTTEFTHPSADRMLAWMNEVAVHMDTAWGGRRSYIKIHISSGQVAEPFVDPETGGPLNFNHLPHYADPRMGVLPHTVQHYGLTDPAPTYGNTNFEHVRSFLQLEAGTREVLWHPETAYWVSFDVDVPLFLPVYAQRRLQDARLLARDEDQGRMGRGIHAGAHMDGHDVFSSGWEWGYWLHDVVTARAGWDPLVDAPDEVTAFHRALRPLTRLLGPAQEQALAARLTTIALDQADLLLVGKVDGQVPEDIIRRNGQAYLQGYETFDDVAELAELIPGVPAPRHQPSRLGLVEMRNPLHAPPRYTGEVDRLLTAMDTTFLAHANALDVFRNVAPPHVRPLVDDLADAMRMTSLRATQVHGLYDYVDGLRDLDPSPRRARLAAARAALDAAQLVVDRREQAYRVPADRIASWGNTPTAYEFGYLWTVRRLFYWWRDEGKAVDAPASPCYLNIINPADVSMGEGLMVSAGRLVRDVAQTGVLSDISQCIAESRAEPVMPPGGLRSRP